MAPLTTILGPSLLQLAALSLFVHWTWATTTTTTASVTVSFASGFAQDGIAKILEADRARIAQMKGASAGKTQNSGGGGGARKRAFSMGAVNNGVTYVASVQVGVPATTYNLVVDTGSSNTWLNASTPYKQTKTSINLGQSVAVSYGSGSFSGTEFLDQVALSDNLVITNQSIGVASTSKGYGNGIDGVLGIGPTDLTQGTLNGSTEAIPTVTDQLYAQGTINAHKVGISFEPTSGNTSSRTGTLMFGGADGSKYDGALTYVNITSTSPASTFFGIDQSLRYGSTTIMNTTAGIVDTGTTLIYVPTSSFNAYKAAVGAIVDNTTGLLQISKEAYADLQDLEFMVGGTSLTLVPNAQIWPREFNTLIGGSADSIYLVLHDAGTVMGSGLDFINGYAFLERFYTLYDSRLRRIGFAPTAFTNATTN